MADDVASLGFAVDSSQLVAASKALDQVNVSAQRLAPAQALAASQTQRLTREQQLSTQANRAAVVAQAELGDKIELLSRNTDAAYRTLSTRSFFKLLAREASLAGGPLAQIIGHFGILTVGGQRLGVGITSATIAFAALALAVTKTVGAFIQFESHQSQIGNALQLTNQASGQTADGLDKMARRLAESGTVALDSVREAQAELIKFKNVGADSFERVLAAAKAISTTGFTDMKTATKAMGEALKDPAEASKTLQEVGISLTAAQQAQIDAFLRLGDVLKANQLILDIIDEKTTNLTQSVNDHASAWTRFKDSFGDAFILMGQRIALELGFKAALDASTDALRKGAEENKKRIGLAPAQAALPAGADSFTDRFGAAEIAAASINMQRLVKAIADTTKALNDQRLTAGMNAVELEIYNNTIAKGIPANTDAAKAIEKMVRANMSAAEFRTTIDALKTQAAATKIAADTTGMSVGATAAYTVAETARQNAIIKGLPLSKEQNALVEQQAKLTGAQTQRKAQETAQSEADFERQTVFMSDLEKQIAIIQRSLHGNMWRDFMNDGLSATLRVNAGLTQLKDSAAEFSKSFVTGILQGKSAIDSAIGAFDQLATKMADKAIMSLFSGDFLMAGVQATVAAVAALSSAFLKSSEAQRKAAENLAKANAAAQQMSSQIGGAGSGSIVQHMTDVNLQTMQILQSFHGAITSASVQLNNDLQAFFRRTVAEFLGGWQASLDQMGDNSAFSQARANVSQLAKTIQDFVNNTRDLGTSSQVLEAQSAGRSTLLAMLAAPKALSDTATELERIHGTATALQAALVTLGMSAEDAAARINEGVSGALADLGASFTGKLTARLNAASGQSVVNDFITLFAQHAQDLADAAALGMGAGLANSVFAAEAQKLVDDSELVGNAFTALTNQFPSLVGVVHEATGAIQDQIRAQNQLNSAASNVVDFLNDLVSGPGSTLSPGAILANAQSVYNANLGQAQAGNLDAVNKFPETANNLLKAAQTMFGSSAQFQAIRAQIISQGLGLPAVQQTTDPTVIAIRDAIAAIQATTAAVGGTTTAVVAVNATTGVVATNTGGNAASLSQIATNTGSIGDISVNTGGTAASLGQIAGAQGNIIANTGNIASFASRSRDISEYYSPRLDNFSNNTANNTGSIGAVSINTGAAANLLNSTNNSGIGAVVINTGNAAQYIGSNDNEGTRGLLTLLTHQLTSSPMSVQLGTNQGVTSFTLTNNNVIDALNKIVLNTFAIALNTFTLAEFMNMSSNGSPRLTGTYAAGGTIPPYGLGLVSEHLNPTMLRAGSQPIHVFPGAAANDNGSVVAEIQALRRESADQNFTIAQLINMLCNLTGKSQQEIVGAIAGLEETTKSEARQDRNNPRWRMTA